MGGCWPPLSRASRLAKKTGIFVPPDWPCLGAALPAVLRRSTAETAQLARRLPAADAERLRTTLLCLARVQRQHGLSLPADLLPRLAGLPVVSPLERLVFCSHLPAVLPLHVNA